MAWVWTLLTIYVVGFLMTLVGHLMFLPMVTHGLALMRALFWFVFLAIGWPHGSPLPMD